MQPLSQGATVSLRQYLLLRPLVQRGPRRQQPHHVQKGRPKVSCGRSGVVTDRDHVKNKKETAVETALIVAMTLTHAEIVA